VQLGGRELGPSFWGTLTYSLLVLVFGLRAMSTHPGPAQRRRYLSLIGFQVVLLFAVLFSIAFFVRGTGAVIRQRFLQAAELLQKKKPRKPNR
jgi:hypothetical protein